MGQWAQVRIVKAGSVTALLSDELQAQLLQLSSSLITYNPPTLAGSTAGGHSFDGSRHALKTISSVTVVRDTHVNSLGVAYSDGTSFNVHGGTGGSSDMFCMDNGKQYSDQRVMYISHIRIRRIYLRASHMDGFERRLRASVYYQHREDVPMLRGR